MLTIRVPSIKCSRFHSQETEDSIDGNDSPGGGAELCPPDFVFLALTRRTAGENFLFLTRLIKKVFVVQRTLMEKGTL